MRMLTVVCALGFATVLTAGEIPAKEPGRPAIRVILLGTAPGPPVRVGWAGISTLVEAGGQRYLFDAG